MGTTHYQSRSNFIGSNPTRSNPRTAYRPKVTGKSDSKN